MPATLAGRVAIRVGAVLLLLFAVHLAYQAKRNVDEHHYLDIGIVHGATRAIVKALPRLAKGDAGAGDALDYFNRPEAPLNAFRVIDPTAGRIVAQGGRVDTLARVAEFVRYDPLRTISEVSEVELDGKRVIWGMLRHDVGDTELLVEVGIQRATHGLMRDALLDELALDVPAFWVLSILATIVLVHLLVRTGLAPLAEARQSLRHGGTALPTLPERFEAAGGPVDDVDGFLSDLRGAFARQSAIVQAQQEFVARSAHELRTPLTLMALDLAGIDDVRARTMEADVHDLSAKIANMLAWARMDAEADGPDGTVDLERIAARVAAGLTPLALRRGTMIVVDCEPGARIRGDQFAVEEALRNLVENAVRHGPEHGRVSVQGRADGTVIVDDDGAGFPTFDADVLCRPFWRGGSSAEGSGLGLALVRRIAERHAASLRFERSPAGGGRVVLGFRGQTAPFN
jgi:signal transduction histidine kinase